MSDEVLLERRAAAALVTFDRPKALNALTLGMFAAIEPALREWAADDAVKSIVVQGAGGRAFCAGGDIRALWDTGPGLGGADDPKRVFFRDEYRLICRVHRLRKPYVALIDGITMGGGAGMSVNGAFRVATENTIFAMPETGIGLFPDVGATRFLSRCPGKVGLYLALTGVRLKAADLLYSGLATHYVARERLEALVAALAAGEAAPAVLARFAGDPGPAPLAPLRKQIDRAFGAGSVEAILAALERDGTDWGAKTLDTLKKMSPTSLKITHRQLELGTDLALPEALALEYRMTQHAMEGGDFFEGVRAVLVDKDQKPRWRPASLAEVTTGEVDRYFAPLGANELTFPE